MDKNNEKFDELKDALVKYLKSNEHNLDKPYIFTANKQWTRRMIIEEIENGTASGLEWMVSMITLAVNSLNRATNGDEDGLEN